MTNDTARLLMKITVCMRKARKGIKKYSILFKSIEKHHNKSENKHHEDRRRTLSG